MNIPIGVTTKKNITPIIIGETILPKIKPNFIHSLLSGVRIFEFKNPRPIKIIDIIIDQILISFS